MRKLLSLIMAIALLLPITATAHAANTVTIEGTIEAIDIENEQISVLSWDDIVYLINIPKDVDIKDLYFDQEVIATIKGNTVNLELINEEDPERDGYIIPGTRFRLGTVLFASNTEIEIITTKAREKYKIDPFSTTLFKRKRLAELRELKEGDRVLLSFDDPYTSTVSEIKIEDEEKHIEGIIKGKIEIVDERNKEILLSEPKKLVEGKWLSTGEKVKLKLGQGKIYEGSKALSLSNLQKRKGTETYIAYENAYGKHQVSKMLLKPGPSMEYKDLLQDIDYGIGQMVVNTNSFSFHEGTIVIKDNRLVDSLNLNQYQEIYLVSDYKNGVRQASVVSIEGTSILEDRIDNSRLLVYKGKIEDILDYKLILGNGIKLDKSVLTNTGFIPSPGLEELMFTEETYIYDSELKLNIPAKIFGDSKYFDLIDIKDKELRDRLEKEYYKNKLAYIVARETEEGKEVLSINLIPQQTNSYNQNINLDYSSMGKIENINLETGTVDISNVANYNNLTKTWEKGQGQTINLDRAIILQNDKPVDLKDLKQIRKNSKVYLINQKQSSKVSTYVLLIEN